MRSRRASRRILAAMLVFMANGAIVTHVLEQEALASGLPLPVIPMGEGEGCVEDTGFMRRNHMDLLTHQRKETVLKGVRTKQHSLKECINCHVVAGPDTAPVGASSAQHFCRTCHDFAAVSIDCFQCHASRPETEQSAVSHAEIMAGASNQ